MRPGPLWGKITGQAPGRSRFPGKGGNGMERAVNRLFCLLLGGILLAILVS